MNRENLTDVPRFVEFNDEDLSHVSAGPDYGQSENFISEKSCSWTEFDSPEYPIYTDEIAKKILKTNIKFSEIK